MFKEGGKSRAICEDCKKQVDTTFQFREHLILPDLKAIVLVSVCDVCDKTVGIPQQSIDELFNTIL